MQEVKDEYYFPQLADLMKDKNATVSDAALSAIGKATGTECITELFKHINDKPKKVFPALENSGESSIPVIITQIESGNLSEPQMGRLITLIGKIKSDSTVPTLLQLLSETNLIPYIVKALYRCRYHAEEQTGKTLEDIARKYLLYGAELLHMQQLLQQKKYPFDILNSSVNIELTDIREVLLCIFGCLYDRSKIVQARIGLNMKNREQVANAMEIIEMTARKDLAHFFNSLYEMESIDHRCSAIQKLFKGENFSGVQHVLGRILSEQPIPYHYWTKASSMYVAKKSSESLDKKLLDKFIHSEIELLKETAIYAGSN
jgi:hypothetical protein